MFNRISGRYDLLNRVISLGLDRAWRRRTIACLGLKPGQRLLDLACGTGDLSELAARAGTQVVGVDFSQGMLEQAEAREIDAELLRADAARLPFADRSFDAMTCGFALRNFADLAVVFHETARVLKTGARIALLEVDEPANPLVASLHRLYFGRLVPLAGRLLSDRAAYSYLPASASYLPSREKLREMLEDAGFDDVNHQRLAAGAVQIVSATRS